MKSLAKAVSLILAMVAFIFMALANMTLCMHIIFKKDNMMQIVDQYMMNAGLDTTNERENMTTDKPDESEPALETKPESEAETKSESESENETKPEPESEAELDSEPASETESKPDTVSESVTEPATEPVTESGTDPVNGKKSVYDVLDSGSESGINAILANPNLLKLMESYGSISNMTEMSNSGAVELSQLGGGFSGIFSGFSTIIKVIKGEYGFVSLMLNFVDSNNLLSTEVIDKAFEDENVAKYYVASENAEELREAFLHTKLASRMTLEAAYVYYDYFNSAKSADNWQERLYTSLKERENEREQDMAFLVGHVVTEDDRELIDALKDALANAVISGMKAPADKATALPGGIHMLLNLFFADRIVITMFIIALIIIVLIFVLSHEDGKGSSYFGFILIFTGIFTAVIRLLKNYVIGPFYNEETSDFKAMTLFLIVGGVLFGVGLIVLIVPGAISNAKIKKRLKNSQFDETVPSFGDISAIAQMGLGDLVMNNNKPQQREDGLIDYYGDGRGLDAQREFKKRKEEEAGKGSNPRSNSGNPADAKKKKDE